VDYPAIKPDYLPEVFEEEAAIGVGPEDVPPLIAAAGDVPGRTRVFEPEGTCHAGEEGGKRRGRRTH
jgi:hypothetical protein